MNQFNHKYKNLSDAIGISESRKDELQELVKNTWNEGSCNSERMEKILSEGLSVIETMYCGFLLGIAEFGCNRAKYSGDPFKDLMDKILKLRDKLDEE